MMQYQVLPVRGVTMNLFKKVPLLMLILFVSMSFSCKKSVPDITEDEETKKEATKDEGKSTDVDRKITDEQFNEAAELIERAKQAKADVYASDLLNSSIDLLKKAKDQNDNSPKDAFANLDASRKASQEAYYQTYKKRALEEKKKAEDLMLNLEANGGKDAFKEHFNEGVAKFDEGDNFFNEENFVNSYNSFSEACDIFSNLKSKHDANRGSIETRIKQVQELIKKAEKLGGNDFAPDELALAKDYLSAGIEDYRANNIDSCINNIQKAEEQALLAINITEKALKEQKRLEALNKIKKAGKAVESATSKEVVDEQGKTTKGLEYKFEIKEDGKAVTSPAPSNQVSYQEVLLKAVDYLEKAKDAYYREDYDMAIRYAEIAEKIALSYSAGGIKTRYTVRLIPEKRDCLWRIAEYDYIYNTPFLWPMIWKSNKQQILNPDLIYPGQILLIPEID